MKIWSLFEKSVREQLREPLVLGVTVGFGAAFMLIFGLAFGDSYYTYRLGVWNRDTAAGGGGAGRAFLQRLEALSYDNGERVFLIEHLAPPSDATPSDATPSDATSTDDGPRPPRLSNELERRLQRRELSAYLELPETLSAAWGGGPPASAVMSIWGDPANPGFGLVRLMLQGALEDFLSTRGEAAPPVSLATGFIEAKVKGGGEFAYLAPGLMLMAIFLLLIQCAMVLVREVQTGTLARLRLSRVHSWEYLIGVGASQVLFAGLMLPLMYGMAVLVGFKGTGSLGTAYLVGLGASGVAIALGLVTAAVSRTVVQAFLWGNLVTIPVVFLSGAFFPIPQRVLFSFGGHPVGALDWLPSVPAVAAMNKVLLYGARLGEVVPELLEMTATSAILFAIGVVLFSRSHLRRT